ncbi:MAG TPA: galactokinase family protein, partial [Roseiflexaceae bacterium]|nr:galactokinase family protein [Roseiflexaceae bacterium]
MWRIDSHTAPDDVNAYIAALNSEAPFFEPGARLAIARAPGRLDLMGGIADYSGSLVLELPLALATVAAVQFDQQPRLTIRSAAAHAIGGSSEVRLRLDDLAPGGVALSYAAVRNLFQRHPARQ